jgi:hypothetical protein
VNKNLIDGDYKLLRNKQITGASFFILLKKDLSETGLEWGPCVELNKLRERVKVNMFVYFFGSANCKMLKLTMILELTMKKYRGLKNFSGQIGIKILLFDDITSMHYEAYYVC